MPARSIAWALPHRSSAEIDPNTLAAGTRLADGLWDLYMHFGVLGPGHAPSRKTDAGATAWPRTSGAGRESAADNGGVLHAADLRIVS